MACFHPLRFYFLLARYASLVTPDTILGRNLAAEKHSSKPLRPRKRQKLAPLLLASLGRTQALATPVSDLEPFASGRDTDKRLRNH